MLGTFVRQKLIFNSFQIMWLVSLFFVAVVNRMGLRLYVSEANFARVKIKQILLL